MRVVFLALSVLMVVVGVIWTLQGIGTIGGSAMSDQRFWAVIGPAVAGFGVALAIVSLRGPGPR
jgi:hypothetical protein